jgi:polyisoprenoid-binding protein YceI
MNATTAPAIDPGTYRIDPSRSTVRFVSRAMFGLFRVGGTFAVRQGTIVVADDVTESSVTATVDAASVDTANTRRDNDLRSAKYLDTERYPDILFASREVTSEEVTGILRVHGSDQRVTLTVVPESAPDGFRFTTTTRVDRYAFGVTGGKGLVSRQIDIELEIVAARAGDSPTHHQRV